MDHAELNSISYDDVRGINFYYNSMPANVSVTCLIDYVEAIIDDGKDGERIKVLENFSSKEFEYAGDYQILSAKSVSTHGLFPASCALVACYTKDRE